MKILASFPLYSHPDVAGAALQSLQVVDTYIVCNNPDLVDVVKGTNHVVNTVNNYCNGAWNQAMEYFLSKDYDWLVLSSQDVILRANWQHLIPAREREIYVPSYTDSLDRLANFNAVGLELRGAAAGACTFLPRNAVELIYPIPSEILLWFGDEYMYTKLRNRGWSLMQAPIAAYHYGSLSIADDEQAHAQIAADKVAWETVRKETI